MFGAFANELVITNSRRIHCVCFLRASGGQDVAILKKQQRKYNSKIRTALHASTILAFGLLASNTALAQDGAGKEYNIPPSDMSEALQAFSEQSDAEIIYAEKDVAEKTTKGIEGEYSRERALEEIIGDSGLVYEVSSDGVIIIKTAYLDVKQAGAVQRFRVAQADRAASRAVETIDTSETDDPVQEEDAGRDEIIVTGTNIRGIAPDSSPTRVFDREDIQISGAATAQDFIQLLPQNFGGGSNADISSGLPNDVNSGFNSGARGSMGSSVNLRGLGSGSTLVLLNGHRLAPSSGIGDFVDISMIPASAIERVEVLTDGASSIYGADAVAGVVNFVLRDDFDGAEASFRYGTVTEGDLDEYRASITGGKSWNTGNALVVYEYFSQGNLSAEDRAFAQEAILPTDLLPSQERHSVLASASQELTSNLELFADFTFSRRESERNTSNTSTSVLLTPVSENLNISAGGEWEISETWVADFSGTYSDVHSEPEQSRDLTSLLEIDSNVWTIDAKTSGSVLRLPGGDLKLAIGGQYRSEEFTTFDVLDNEIGRVAERDVYAAFGEAFIPIIGADNAVPGIERLEINVSGRFEDFSDFGSTVNPKVGVLWSPVENLNLRGSYSTSFNPPPLGRVGATDFLASAAPTSVFNTIFGLTPGDPSIADVVVLTASGTGRDLDAENSRSFTAGFDFSEQWGRHELTINSTFFDIEFENRLGTTPLPENRISFDAPNIAFNSPELFPDGTIIFSPSIEQINDFLNSLDEPISVFFDVDPLDAEIINRVLVVRNLSRTSVSGIDFNVAYTMSSDVGSFSFGLDGTFLADFQQQAAVSTPLVEQVDTLFNPADLRIRGRAGYAGYNGFTANIFVNYTDDYRVDNTVGAMAIDSWTTVDVSLSYDTRERFENPILDNTILRLSVLNLFNEDPPSTPSDPSFFIFGFDPTNASPLGRFIAVELTKAF